MADPATDARPGLLPAWVVDAGVAAVAIAVTVMAATHIHPDGSERPVDWFGVVLVVVAGGSLALRRRAPLGALVLVGTALSVYAVRDHPGGPVFALGPILLFSYMVRSERRPALLAAAGFGLAMLVARLVAGHGFDVVTLLWAGWVIAPTLGSEVARGRFEQRRLAEARRREEQRHEAETLRRQLVEERLRIARDLHDSVAHSMATINVQAGVAAHVIEQRPLAARDALEVIRATSGEVLDELAAMLRLLRADAGEPAGERPAVAGDGPTASAGSDPGPAGIGGAGGRNGAGRLDGPGDDGPAPRQPTADLTRLDALVASSRRAGLEVELLVGDVDLAHVPPTVSTSAYRIVQEALTNVIRHAGTDRATVAVLRTPAGGLSVEVRDDGSRVAALTPAPAGGRGGSGMGLIGIRERAAATGATVDVGPRPQGGFLVRVTWP